MEIVTESGRRIQVLSAFINAKGLLAIVIKDTVGQRREVCEESDGFRSPSGVLRFRATAASLGILEGEVRRKMSDSIEKREQVKADNELVEDMMRMNTSGGGLRLEDVNREVLKGSGRRPEIPKWEERDGGMDCW